VLFLCACGEANVRHDIVELGTTKLSLAERISATHTPVMPHLQGKEGLTVSMCSHVFQCWIGHRGCSARLFGEFKADDRVISSGTETTVANLGKSRLVIADGRTLPYGGLNRGGWQ
jgi:hypothetical protein